jgi:hypothetical protein
MVMPLTAAYTRIFKGWLELGSMLVQTFDEWAQIDLKETGNDHSDRVETVRATLEEAALSSLQIAIPDSTDREVELLEMTDIDVELTDILSPCEFSKGDVDQKSILVREVRRWRDQGEKSNLEKGQHRELVLLYVLSDGGAYPVDKDIIMKFGTSCHHFCEPQDKTQQLALPSDQADSDTPVVKVEVAADNMRSNVDQADFDRLLSALLEDKINMEREACMHY